jgi:hypothetical protein
MISSLHVVSLLTELRVSQESVGDVGLPVPQVPTIAYSVTQNWLGRPLGDRELCEEVEVLKDVRDQAAGL